MIELSAFPVSQTVIHDWSELHLGCYYYADLAGSHWEFFPFAVKSINSTINLSRITECFQLPSSTNSLAVCGIYNNQGRKKSVQQQRTFLPPEVSVKNKYCNTSSPAILSQANFTWHYASSSTFLSSSLTSKSILKYNTSELSPSAGATVKLYGFLFVTYLNAKYWNKVI